MSRNATNLTGRAFGRLTVLRRADNIGDNAAWLCKCSCGRRSTVRAGSLLAKSKPTQSCGCLHREITAERMANLRGAARQRYSAEEIIMQTFSADPRELLKRLGIRVADAAQCDERT